MYRKGVLVCAVCSLVLLTGSPSHAEDEWQFAARINGWFPNTEGTTAFLDQDFELKVEDVLSSVQFGFMGSFEARKGKWGITTDLIYAAIGDDEDNLRERSLGPRQQLGVETKVSADLDVESWIWNTAGFCRVYQSEAITLDLLAGIRYLDVEQELKLKINTSIEGQPLPEQKIRAEVGEDFWDAFVGVRGRVPLGESGKWFIPFYLDGGTGDSDFTWQAATGLGYATDGRWNFGLTWRHLEYDLDSGAEIAELSLSGPAAVFEYNW